MGVSKLLDLVENLPYAANGVVDLSDKVFELLGGLVFQGIGKEAFAVRRIDPNAEAVIVQGELLVKAKCRLAGNLVGQVRVEVQLAIVIAEGEGGGMPVCQQQSPYKAIFVLECETDLVASCCECECVIALDDHLKSSLDCVAYSPSAW